MPEIGDLLQWYHGTWGGIMCSVPQCWGQFRLVDITEDIMYQMGTVECQRCGAAEKYALAILRKAEPSDPPIDCPEGGKILNKEETI